MLSRYKLLLQGNIVAKTLVHCSHFLLWNFIHGMISLKLRHFCCKYRCRLRLIWHYLWTKMRDIWSRNLLNFTRSQPAIWPHFNHDQLRWNFNRPLSAVIMIDYIIHAYSIIFVNLSIWKCSLEPDTKSSKHPNHATLFGWFSSSMYVCLTEWSTPTCTLHCCRLSRVDGISNCCVEWKIGESYWKFIINIFFCTSLSASPWLHSIQIYENKIMCTHFKLFFLSLSLWRCWLIFLRDWL